MNIQALRVSFAALSLALVSAGCGGNKACCKGGANSSCAEHHKEGGQGDHGHDGKPCKDCPEGAKHAEHAGPEHKGLAAGSFKMMSFAELDAARAASPKTVFVFDANGADKFKSGHIPGAVWVAHDGVKAEVLPADKAATVVFYCFNPKCSASHQAAANASALGYTNVFVLPEGIDGWQKAGRATEPGK